MKEYIAVERQTDNGGYVEIVSELIRCKDCKFHHDRTQCSKRIGAWFDDDYCNGAVSAERKEE